MSTPLKLYPFISEKLGINLLVKHDDYFPFTGGGNKARKIEYIIKKARQCGSNALVSAGAANSNHARVVALAAAQLGWKCKIIIHDKEDYTNGNLIIMKLAGAELVFVEQKEVAKSMDKAMLAFKSLGLSPFYIWGGGHLVEGSLAYYDAFNELVTQTDVLPDYIIHASGTGTTQAGLHVGAALQEKCKTEVIGISVARDTARGTEAVAHSVSELIKYLGLFNQSKNIANVNFFDNWNSGGYGLYNSAVIEIIKWAAKAEGLMLDPTYTGKAFLALTDMVSSQRIRKGSNVVFWHTGGLINLLNSGKGFTI